MDYIKELVDKLKDLSPDDVVILKNVPQKTYTFVVDLASKLNMLPSQVQEAVDRLKGHGFIEDKAEAQPESKVDRSALLDLEDAEFTLSEEGDEARSLLPLIDKGGNQ